MMSSAFVYSSGTPFSRQIRLSLLGLWLLFSGLVPAFCAELSAGEKPTLKTAGEFWNLPPEDKTQDHTIALHFTVRFYDPEWQVLWGEQDGLSFFLKTGGQALPIKQGDIVKLRGLISEAAGLRVDPKDVEVTGQTSPPEPVDITLLIDKAWRYDHKFVRLTGMVDFAIKPDPNHTKIGMIVHGVPITTQLISKSPPPKIGAALQASGMLALEPNPSGKQSINLWVVGDENITLKYWVQNRDTFRLDLTPVSKIESAPRNMPVHVRGRVKIQEPGSGLWMTDDTGEVFIESPQRNHLDAGTLIEAIGGPGSRGNRPFIAEGRFFTIAELGNPSVDNVAYERPPVKSGNDLYALDVKDKQADLPVDIVFRVLFYDPYWKTLWAEDNKTRFYIPPGETPMNLRAGQLVQLKGLYSEPLGLRAKNEDILVLEEAPTTPPPDATDELSSQSTLNGRNVLLTGYVEKQSRIDSHHISIELLVNERRVQVIILTEQDQIIPSFQGAMVTAQGLLSYTAPTGNQEENFALMVSSADHIHQLHWLRSDARFGLPLSPISSFSDIHSPNFIRVAGQVVACSPGKHVDLRDETGQVRVLSLQRESLEIGEHIDAFGIAEAKGLSYTLRKALYIRSSSTLQKINPALTNQTLRLIGQISALGIGEAARKFPAALHVHVTWSDPSRRDFYGEDSSGGVQFILGSSGLIPPVRGDIIDVIGETDGDGTYPRVRAAVLRKIRTQDIPKPSSVTLEQLHTGVAQNTTVELRAILTRSVPEGKFLRLHFTCNSGSFQALLPMGQDPSPFLGAIVRIQGLCTLSASGLRSPDVTLLLHSTEDLSILEPAPSALLSIPLQNIASIALNPPRPRSEKWIRTFGTLTYKKEGSHLYIQEGNDTLRVFCSQITGFKPGDNLDIIGLPAWSDNQLVLREAFVRKSKSGAEPPPRTPPTPYTPNSDYENSLVSMEGLLISALELDQCTILTLQNQGHFFTGEIPRRNGDSPLDLSSGLTLRLTLRLTGIYHASSNKEGHSTNLSLELRSPEDVVILQKPSWLSPERAITIVATLSAISLLAAAWIVQLRRRVHRQTLTIRSQMEKEAQLTADLERATRLESLGMLAGGIAHDFNNMLTIIVGNLSLARMDAPEGSPMISFLQEAERGAMRARNLTQQLLTFARGGHPIRKPENLGKLIVEEANDATSNGQLQLSYNISPDTCDAYIDRAQIAQVVQNLINNSIQATATRVAITLRNEELLNGNAQGLKAGAYVRFSFLDDGPGIPQENLGKIFDPYFTTHKSQRGLGLSLVRSIMLKHEGFVGVNSEPGSGAEFTLWLPTAPATSSTLGSAQKQNSSPSAQPSDSSKAGSGADSPEPASASILLMDDEAPVRLMIHALMRKLGYKVTLTADGAAAVREYKTAMEAGRRFDLVILDLSVPNGMGGMEAMEQLRKLDPKVLAIVSSGYSNDPIMADHHSFGFAAMVPKPYAIEELTKTVESLLRK